MEGVHPECHRVGDADDAADVGGCWGVGPRPDSADSGPLKGKTITDVMITVVYMPWKSLTVPTVAKSWSVDAAHRKLFKITGENILASSTAAGDFSVIAPDYILCSCWWSCPQPTYYRQCY